MLSHTKDSDLKYVAKKYPSTLPVNNALCCNTDIFVNVDK